MHGLGDEQACAADLAEDGFNRGGCIDQGYAGLADFLFRTPGALRKTVPEWVDYFRPGFHPWDHDNKAYLDRMPEFEADMQRMMEGPKAA